MKVIALKGEKDTGRTQALKYLHSILLEHAYKHVGGQDPEKTSDKDKIYTIYRKEGKDIKVALVAKVFEQIGDYLKDLEGEGCDIVVCAIPEERANVVEQYDHEFHETKPLDHADPQSTGWNYHNLANVIYKKIDEYVKA